MVNNEGIYPIPMGYLNIVTTIANHCNISIQEAIKKYYSLTGIPSYEYYETIIHEQELFTYNCQVVITKNTDILDELNIPYKYAGKQTYVIDMDIAIEDENVKIYYLLKDCSGLYFKDNMFKKRAF